jgi:hypothetical protein
MAKKRARGKKGKKIGARRKVAKPKMAKKTAAASKKRAERNEQARRARLSRGLDDDRARIIPEGESERSFAAGQSSDVEGLSDVEDVDSESVEELAEEGQDYEAEIVEGVERAASRPGEEVRTDVPEEERPRPARRTL